MDLLLRPVVDEVLGDAEAGVALDVVHKVLLAVAPVEHFEHQIGPPALVGDDPRQALVVLGLLHGDDGEDVRREDLRAGVHHAHLLRQVDDSAHRLEVKAEHVDSAALGLLVGPPLRHRDVGIREGVVDLDQEALALGLAHRAPHLCGGADGERGRRAHPGGKRSCHGPRLAAQAGPRAS